MWFNVYVVEKGPSMIPNNRWWLSGLRIHHLGEEVQIQTPTTNFVIYRNPKGRAVLPEAFSSYV